MTDQPTAKSMWEERYDADHYVYGTEPNEFLFGRRRRSQRGLPRRYRTTSLERGPL
jgi:hypothetical protein